MGLETPLCDHIDESYTKDGATQGCATRPVVLNVFVVRGISLTEVDIATVESVARSDAVAIGICAKGLGEDDVDEPDCIE